MPVEILFWSSALFVFYAYGGYPLVLWTVMKARNREVVKGDVYPSVSFIITAYNEEQRIREKLDNTLLQEYPKDLLEIIVASDASTDQTDAIVKEYQPSRVRLIRAPERKGKEHAQWHAVESASGEILVFSDVGTLLDPHGIRNIVRNFNDPTVGCVSSIDRLIDANGTLSGEGAYVRYEMALRSLETRANTLVGLSGSFFAARRDVCRPWATDLQSDFNTLLNSVRKGLRGVLDTESIGYYRNIRDESKEYDRKIRTVVRGIHVVTRHLSLLNPLQYGVFSWQLFSHKLCRWLVPFGMIAVFLTNLALLQYSAVYRLLFAVQICFYAVATVGILLGNTMNRSFLKIPAFFLVVNLSILHAWYRYLVKGEQIVRWEPSVR
jgi:glycosyltransferase involved in cell wall biosynthesis